MSGFGKWASTTVAALVVAAGSAVPAAAYSLDNMSCGQLWYARNAIYARQGYCFKTERAREVFGRGCFPPFGQLSGWQQSRVSDIQYAERAQGCSD